MIAFPVAANLMLKLGAGLLEAQRVFRAARLEAGDGARCVRVRRNRLCPPAPPGAAQHCSGVRGTAIRRGRHCRPPSAGEAISAARWLGIACISFGLTASV